MFTSLLGILKPELSVLFLIFFCVFVCFFDLTGLYKHWCVISPQSKVFKSDPLNNLFLICLFSLVVVVGSPVFIVVDLNDVCYYYTCFFMFSHWVSPFYIRWLSLIESYGTEVLNLNPSFTKFIIRYLYKSHEFI